MIEPYQVTIVSHTHWDRAWYVTFQEFRARLVRLVDRLLKLLEEQPDYRVFTLDGQMAVLEDYLEVRPQRKAIHQWQPYHLKTYMNNMTDIEAFRAFGLDAAITT